MSSGADLTALLAQTGWIRALARTLAADSVQADDLTQDAWVAALERPPRTDSPLRGWLASVLRHRSTDLRRARGARERHERAAARPEALPSVHDVVEKAALQRALVEAVLGLDEPYRTTVLLRFFEALPQREIARRMQTTTATVNSRLARGLEQLRERLSRGGERAAWLSALAPLIEPRSIVPVASLGVVMKLAAALVVAASVIVGIALWRSPPGAPRADASAPEIARAAPAHPEGSSAPAPAAAPRPAAVESERAVLAAKASAAAPDAPVIAAESAAAPRILRGRVLDAFGSGVAGVALALGSQEGSALESRSRCTSGPVGWFEIALDAPAHTILAADPRFTTVRAGLARVREETHPLVVVAPRIELAGFVRDEAGAPLGGAFVGIDLPAGFGTSWGLVLDFSVPQTWTARSSDDGRFVLATAPALEGAVLRASLGGYEPSSGPAPLSSDRALEIVLARPRARDGLMRGIVVDPAGAPVEGARVGARGDSTATGYGGEFALDLEQEGTRPPLIALKRGFLPALFEPERDSSGKPDWPGSVVLRLGGSPSTLDGRVLDEDGRPVAGAKVWLDDPTHFGRVGELDLAVESLLRGDERFWSFELTRADGTFSIDGLIDRPYRLQAVEPSSLVSVESEPVRASDSPIELVLPTSDVHERVAGRVVTRDGEPVPGVNVWLLRITFELHFDQGVHNDGQDSERVTTDADGAFLFEGVPKEGVHLIVNGDTILFAGTSIEQEPDPTAIEIVVSRRMHLQVELDPPVDRADKLRVLDAGGETVGLRVMRGEGAHYDEEMPILDGRSAVIALDDSAALLVLYRGADEVARLPLQLAPGAPNVVRY